MSEPTSIDSLLEEGRRQIAICNGCRYCEGYCAVFPAMERLPLVGHGDLTYLANLCHDCRACYQACMYAEPHPFAVQIPTLMSEARERSYAEFARPRWFARWFTAGPRAVAVLTIVGALLFALLATVAGNGGAVFAPDKSAESFFDVFPVQPHGRPISRPDGLRRDGDLLGICGLSPELPRHRGHRDAVLAYRAP